MPIYVQFEYYEVSGLNAIVISCLRVKGRKYSFCTVVFHKMDYLCENELSVSCSISFIVS